MTPRKGTMPYFWSRVNTSDTWGCWPFVGYKSKDGYGKLSYRGEMWLAHRLAWFLNYGEIPESYETLHGTVIRHGCDNPACCNPDHLLVGTQIGNIEDRVRRRRNGNHKGEAHGKAILDNEAIKYIRSSDLSGAELGKRYGVTRTAIWQVRHNKNWSHT